MNKSSTNSSVLFVMALFPLIYIVDSTKDALVAAIGILFIYPLMGTVSILLLRRISHSIHFYIVSLASTLLSGFYLLLINSLDLQVYNHLKFIFPASMASCSIMILWIDENTTPSEKKFGQDAVLLAILLVITGAFRELLTNGSIDTQIGAWGSVWHFPHLAVNGISLYKQAITLFIVGLGLMLISIGKNHHDSH